MKAALLEPELLRRLEQFQLVAGRRSRSSIKGERRSRARGHSVEFADYRSYVPGDDFRYLDWNLYGRLDRLFLKLYEEERELSVLVLLDASESMTFGEPRKFDFARCLAAAAGYVALCGFDRVTVVPFPATSGQPPSVRALRGVRGRGAGPALFEHLGRLEAGGVAAFSRVMRRVALETRKVGLAIVLSDFLDPDGYSEGLGALLGRGFQVCAVQVLASEEMAPVHYGDMRLVDAETGAMQEVTFGRHRLRAYQRSVERYCDGLRTYCRSHGVAWYRTTSDASVEDTLLKGLRQARVWG
jgi:uncharacterized protein (DUF58 family)